MQVDHDAGVSGGEVQCLNLSWTSVPPWIRWSSGGRGRTRLGGPIDWFDAVERLGTVSLIPMPGGECSGQRPGPLDLDRRGPQGVTPSDFSKVPAGERDRIVDHDDQELLAAGVLLADLGVSPLDQQPAPAARPRQRRVVEAD
jgi:hypothetical protein